MEDAAGFGECRDDLGSVGLIPRADELLAKVEILAVAGEAV
jgi:hypothetical protein